MPGTIATTPQKNVVRIAHDDFVAEVDGKIVGNADTYDDAQALADHSAYTMLATEQALLDDPTVPFGTLGGPTSDLSVDLTYLDRAVALIRATYADHPGIIKRLDNAANLVRHQMAHLHIAANGDLTVRGGSRTPYTVSDMQCDCMDYRMRHETHLGLCKHTIARELIRLVQALAAADQPPPSQALAEVPGPTLLGLLGFVRLACELETASIAVTITGATLTVAMSGYTATAPLPFAQGDASITLTPEQFAQQLWPVLKQQQVAGLPSVALLIEDQRMLELSGTGVSLILTP